MRTPAIIQRGGHLQVGLETNPDCGRRNTDMVAAAAELCRDVGLHRASNVEARNLLGLRSAISRPPA